MKKKYVVSSKNKKDWIDFTKQIGNINTKESDFFQDGAEINKVRKLDLHGISLSESNKIVKKFVLVSFNQGYKKLLIITGKGLRSKVRGNPYLSEEMNVLKYSVHNNMLTKTGMMVGLGETDSEVFLTMNQIRNIGVEIFNVDFNGMYVSEKDNKTYINSFPFDEEEGAVILPNPKFFAISPHSLKDNFCIKW